MVRAPSAYFLFADSVREEVTALLRDDAGRVRVSEVGKAIGARWKALEESEREAWKATARERKEELEREEELEKGAAGAAGEDAGVCDHSAALGVSSSASRPAAAPNAVVPSVVLPHGVLKRLVLLDPDVRRVSADAVDAIGAAAAAFVGSLARRARAEAARAGRRVPALKDVLEVAKSDERMRAMGLEDALQVQVEARESERHAGKVLQLEEETEHERSAKTTMDDGDGDDHIDNEEEEEEEEEEEGEEEGEKEGEKRNAKRGMRKAAEKSTKGSPHPPRPAIERSSSASSKENATEAAETSGDPPGRKRSAPPREGGRKRQAQAGSEGAGRGAKTAAGTKSIASFFAPQKAA